MTEFDVATAVQPLGDGAYAATVTPGWSAPAGPNGGYMAALVLTALTAEVGDPERAPRSLTCHFLRPPAEAPCRIEVTVERRGRSLTTLSARLLQEDKPMVMAIAAFSRPFPSAAQFGTAAPDVLPPDALRVPRQAPPPFTLPPISQRVAFQQTFGGAVFSGTEEALVGGWTRLAQPRPTDAAVLALYADCWLPPIWTKLTRPAACPTVDLTIHFRATLPHGPDPEAPVLTRYRTRTAQEGFIEEDGELWAADGTLLAQSRQLALLRAA